MSLSSNQLEQEQEIEALKAIYAEDFELKSSHPFPKFQITLHDSPHVGDLQIFIEYVEKYPFESPCIVKIISSSLKRDDEEIIKDQLTKKMTREFAGSIAVFNIISFINEKLEELYSRNFEGDDSAHKSIKKDGDEEQVILLTRHSELSDINPKKVQFSKGTPVTPENFMEWKKNFDRDYWPKVVEKRRRLQMAITMNSNINKDDGSGNSQQQQQQQLTGRQIFEQKSKFIDESLIKMKEEEAEKEYIKSQQEKQQKNEDDQELSVDDLIDEDVFLQ